MFLLKFKSIIRKQCIKGVSLYLLSLADNYYIRAFLLTLQIVLYYYFVEYEYYSKVDNF